MSYEVSPYSTATTGGYILPAFSGFSLVLIIWTRMSMRLRYRMTLGLSPPPPGSPWPSLAFLEEADTGTPVTVSTYKKSKPKLR